MSMMKFFKELVKPKSIINQAALLEAQKAFSEVKELQKSNNIDDLKKALFMVSETEKKYPFCFDTARYYRGEIISSLADKDDFMSPKFSTSSPKR
jgi:hypothetical protein